MTGRITELPDGLALDSHETPDHVVLVWTADLDASILQRSGVRTPHTTRCTRGVVEFRFLEESESPIRLRAGQQVELPLRRGYRAHALADDTEVRCFYRKAAPGAVEEIAHLRTTIDRRKTRERP